jgi:hypothetical protein
LAALRLAALIPATSAPISCRTYGQFSGGGRFLAGARSLSGGGLEPLDCKRFSHRGLVSVELTGARPVNPSSARDHNRTPRALIACSMPRNAIGDRGHQRRHLPQCHEREPSSPWMAPRTAHLPPLVYCSRVG